MAIFNLLLSFNAPSITPPTHIHTTPRAVLLYLSPGRYASQTLFSAICFSYLCYISIYLVWLGYLRKQPVGGDEH